jgi:hypothetical protein
MTYLRPLPSRAVLRDVFAAFPLTAADAEAVLAAGWEEQALHDAASVCGLFNLMNRLVEGLGIHADADYFRLSAERLATQGYAGLLASSMAPEAGSGGAVGDGRAAGEAMTQAGRVGFG